MALQACVRPPSPRPPAQLDRLVASHAAVLARINDRLALELLRLGTRAGQTFRPGGPSAATIMVEPPPEEEMPSCPRHPCPPWCDRSASWRRPAMPPRRPILTCWTASAPPATRPPS